MAEYYEQAAIERAAELARYLVQQHRKHGEGGAENVKRDGLLGLAVRIGDRLTDLRNMAQGQNWSRGEMREKALSIAGYCLIILMVLDGEYARPLKGIPEEELDLREIERAL